MATFSRASDTSVASSSDDESPIEVDVRQRVEVAEQAKVHLAVYHMIAIAKAWCWGRKATG